MLDQRPNVGAAYQLEEGLTCVLAPNASPMTHWGTNTYILGGDHVAVIDPGPLDKAHHAALLHAIGGRTVSHILVTHSHVDHSPLARPLAKATGAPVLAFGGSTAGRSAVMADLANRTDLGGGEGVDHAFVPDVNVRDQETVTGDGWSLTALHTPGHFGNHMSFLWHDVLFTGDHLMGWAPSLVSPPDGDLTEFMASCRRLVTTRATRAYAGHGAPIANVQHRLRDIIAHRVAREKQIMDALRDGASTLQDLTDKVYVETPSALLPMAKRNVLAHLIDLVTRGLVRPDGPAGTPITPTGRFTLI